MIGPADLNNFPAPLCKPFQVLLI